MVSEVEADISKNIPNGVLAGLCECVTYFIVAQFLDALRRRVVHAIELNTRPRKLVVKALLRLHKFAGKEIMGDFEPEGFLDSCKSTYGIEAETAQKYLIGLSLVNRYANYSTNINMWMIPKWAHAALFQINKNPYEFGISACTQSELGNQLLRTQAKELITWLVDQLDNPLRGVIGFSNWEKGKQEFDNRFEFGDFAYQIGQLLKVGAVAVLSNTNVNTRGYRVYINPDGLELL